jgi:hypothetical protein
MPGLVPGIHVLTVLHQEKTWMAGTSPAMTEKKRTVDGLKKLRCILPDTQSKRA